MNCEAQPLIPVVGEKEEVMNSTSYKTPIILVFVLSMFSIIGLSNYYPSSSLTIPTMDFSSKYTSKQTKLKKNMKLDKVTAKKNDYKLFSKNHAKGYTKGEFKNKYMEHLIVDESTDAFHPYAYLKQKFLTTKYKTVGHGLDKDGNVVKGQSGFFNIDVALFRQVYKTHYSKEDKSVIESRVLLGSFKGLNEEGDAIFIGGAYCEAEDGPSYGKMVIDCGPDFKITEIFQKSPCELYVKITHPIQCQKPVLKVEPTDLMNGEAVPGTPYHLPTPNSVFAPIAAGTPSPFEALWKSWTSIAAAPIAPSKSAVQPAIEPSLGPNLVE